MGNDIGSGLAQFVVYVRCPLDGHVYLFFVIAPYKPTLKSNV